MDLFFKVAMLLGTESSNVERVVGRGCKPKTPRWNILCCDSGDDLLWGSGSVATLITKYNGVGVIISIARIINVISSPSVEVPLALALLHLHVLDWLGIRDSPRNVVQSRRTEAVHACGTTAHV